MGARVPECFVEETLPAPRLAVGNSCPFTEPATSRREPLGPSHCDKITDSRFGQLDEQIAGASIARGENAPFQRRHGNPIIVERVTSGSPSKGSARSQNLASPASIGALIN